MARVDQKSDDLEPMEKKPNRCQSISFTFLIRIHGQWIKGMLQTQNHKVLLNKEMNSHSVQVKLEMVCQATQSPTCSTKLACLLCTRPCARSCGCWQRAQSLPKGPPAGRRWRQAAALHVTRHLVGRSKVLRQLRKGTLPQSRATAVRECPRAGDVCSEFCRSGS